MSSLELGKYLLEKRNEKHLSIYRLSKLSGVSHSYISQLERGVKEQPSPDILNKLAEALGVDYGVLMQKAGHIDPKKFLWLYDDEDIDEEYQSKMTKKLIDLLNDDSISFNEKKSHIASWLQNGNEPLTELKDFLNQPGITFAGVPINDAYGQRVLDILNAVFWDDIQKLRSSADEE